MRRLALAALASGCAAGALAAGSAPTLSVDDIIARNATARGGIEAWRQVHTMTWVGHIESAHAPMPSLQFLMEQERPNKTRFEINAMSDKTVRVFDGAHGWKARAGHDARPQVRPYTIEELRYAQATQGIDGPLLDHAAKGIQVTLGGIDELDGSKAYRLELRLPSGERDRLWVDATTFLDVRYDRTPANAGGSVRVVSARYRDYKTFDGLQMPTVIETGTSSSAGGAPDRMVIERVLVNPPLDRRTFADPAGSRTRNALNYTPRPQSRARAPVATADPAPAADPSADSPPR